MSTNLKNPTDQDDPKKGMLRDQPQLLGVTPTEHLANKDSQPIQGVTSFSTDFEMHTHVQGYYKEHLTSAIMVTCLSEMETLMQTV
jgi:hypothetical protein